MMGGCDIDPAAAHGGDGSSTTGQHTAF